MRVIVRRHLRKGRIVRKHRRIIKRIQFSFTPDEDMSYEAFKRREFPEWWRADREKEKQQKAQIAEQNRLKKEEEKAQQRALSEIQKRDAKIDREVEAATLGLIMDSPREAVEDIKYEDKNMKTTGRLSRRKTDIPQGRFQPFPKLSSRFI